MKYKLLKDIALSTEDNKKSKVFKLGSIIEPDKFGLIPNQWLLLGITRHCIRALIQRFQAFLITFSKKSIYNPMHFCISNFLKAFFANKECSSNIFLSSI